MTSKPVRIRGLALGTGTSRLVLLGLGLLGAAAAWGAGPERPLTFERDIWPIVAANCVSCHGVNQLKGGLDLRSVATMLRGGKSGPALDTSDPEASLLLERIAQGEMPPGKARKLSAEEVAVVRAWIGGGARSAQPRAAAPPVSPIRDADRQFWSFRPLRRPPVPSGSRAGRVRTPIDGFVRARLEAKGLAFSTDADPTTLIRRASLDLLGLPPSPQEIDAFLADHQPGAFERLVDRLLASPHYGERWGRHWLDVAGYVDTVGFDTDATHIILSEGKWLYRDYVIRAINEDKPYDRFLTEQLAGDELHDWRRARHLEPEMRQALIATGYLRTARDLTHEDVGVIPQNFFGILHDTIEIVGTGLLGLTVNCARCHSHKFDPIPQEDYYRLMAIFTPAYNPRCWRAVIPTETKFPDRGLPDVSPAEQAEIERQNAEVDRALGELKGRLSQVRRRCADRLLEAKLAVLPAVIRADVKNALQTPEARRNEVQKYLAAKFGASLTIQAEAVTAGLSAEEKATVTELEARVAATEARRRKWGKIQALTDVGPPPPTHLLIRGSELSPGAEVRPGFLRVLCRSDAEALVRTRPPHAGTSGRRTALARWLTEAGSPASALVARVMVNRVWKHLFGQGIVPTPENFGVQGQPPTHPELLEWLSCELVDNGWRIKPLIRLIMSSTVYRQASRRDPSLAESGPDPDSIDPGDELLWRMRLRRLESEVVRDAILSVSGDRNDAAGGPPVPIVTQPDGRVDVAQDKLANPRDRFKRSLYLTTRRAYNLSLLTVFDQPLGATNCLKRSASAVPLQSLFLLNDGFLAEQAEHFARRVERAVGRGSADPAPEPTEGLPAEIERAFRMALARRPSANETATCRDLLRRQAELFRAGGLSQGEAEHQALAQLCLTLFNTNEFLYAE
jgi:mono/diheme cytochrome c family protein